MRLRKPSEKSKKCAAEERTTTAKKATGKKRRRPRCPATGKKRRGAKKAAAALEASDSDDDEEDDSSVPSDSDGEDTNGEEGNEDDDEDAEEKALDAALEKQHFIKVKLVYPPPRRLLLRLFLNRRSRLKSCWGGTTLSARRTNRIRSPAAMALTTARTSPPSRWSDASRWQSPGWQAESQPLFQPTWTRHRAVRVFCFA